MGCGEMSGKGDKQEHTVVSYVHCGLRTEGKRSREEARQGAEVEKMKNLDTTNGFELIRFLKPGCSSKSSRSFKKTDSNIPPPDPQN